MIRKQLVNAYQKSKQNKSNWFMWILLAIVLYLILPMWTAKGTDYIPKQKVYLSPQELDLCVNQLIESAGVFNDNEQQFLDGLRMIFYKSDFDVVRSMVDIKLENDLTYTMLMITSFESLRARIIDDPESIGLYNSIINSYVD